MVAGRAWQIKAIHTSLGGETAMGAPFSFIQFSILATEVMPLTFTRY